MELLRKVSLIVKMTARRKGMLLNRKRAKNQRKKIHQLRKTKRKQMKVLINQYSNLYQINLAKGQLIKQRKSQNQFKRKVQKKKMIGKILMSIKLLKNFSRILVRQLLVF